jgi:hypothetical protein
MKRHRRGTEPKEVPFLMDIGSIAQVFIKSQQIVHSLDME